MIEGPLPAGTGVYLNGKLVGVLGEPVLVDADTQEFSNAFIVTAAPSLSPSCPDPTCSTCKDTECWRCEHCAFFDTKPRCPECVNGKHVNCTGEALDEATDSIVPCECACPVAQPPVP